MQLRERKQELDGQIENFEPRRQELLVQETELTRRGEELELRAGVLQREQEALGGAATSATTIFSGFGVGLAYKALNVAFKGWKDVPQRIFGPPFAAGSISAEISPELLGVGYIIGPKIGSTMCAG